jgi:hypothetical protein
MVIYNLANHINKDNTLDFIWQFIPENNTKTNIKLFLLDPLSVIIKLAILSNKPIGTKILIHNNVLYFQEPGIFQSVTRYYYNTNK